MSYLPQSFYARTNSRLSDLESATTIPTNIQTALNGKANTSHTHAISDVTSLQSSLDAKASTSALTTALAGKADTSVTSGLNTRLTSAETTLSTLSTANTRLTSLETWRGAKAAAKSNVTTSYSVPTAVITLGLNAPTAAGINSIVNTIMGEINGIYDVLRTREIMAV